MCRGIFCCTPISYKLFLFLFVYYILIEFTARLAFQEIQEDSIQVFLLKAVLLIFWIRFIIKFNHSKRDPFINLILIWSIYLLFTNFFFVKELRDLFTLPYKLLFWPLSLMFSYHYFRKYENKRKVLFKLALIFLIVLMAVMIFFFIKEYQITNEERINSRTTLNVAYFFLLMVPWVFYVNNRLVRNFLLIILMAIILLSVKRTAIIAFFASVFFGFGIEIFMMEGNKKAKYFLNFIVICIIAFFMLIAINEFSSGWIFSRFESISEDRGSSRLDIYARLSDLLGRSSLLELIVGHGHNTVKNFMFDGLSAHNDWLECLFDYGVIGLTLYLSMHIMILKKIRIFYRTKSPYTSMLMASYIIFLLMSLSSHLIMYPYLFIIMTIMWGALWGVTTKYSSAHEKRQVWLRKSGIEPV